MKANMLKFGTPKSNLLMSVSDVRVRRGVVEFDIHPPSPFSHVMTLYSPQENVEVRPIGDDHSLGDMQVKGYDGNTIFLIENKDK